ncbi:MAG: phosphoglycerate dehydrogenase [Candidatus Eremiobacteraeota bacterium]|nr:phosphoglycerate dehydrogenase [Candidatus Eremiobacteraeota bacterium]MBV8282209.1 phosphoglycerate dehydrogenase [Candidatus Eremiobacteraeota bacterium]
MKIVVLSIPNWSHRLVERLGSAYSIADVDAKDQIALARELPDADILVSGSFSAALAPLCRSLRLLISPWAGTENIDRSALPAGVAVVSSGGTEEPIAEYAIAMLVALRRRLREADRALRSGEWAFGFWGGAFVDELFDSTLGLLGFGRIGREVVKRAHAFGMRCSALTLHPERAVDVSGCAVGPLAELDAVDSLVADVDALVICCELSDITRGMIDARRLALMKASAAIVNVARAPICVERDLYEALRQKRIAGAALDVWYEYPKAAGERMAPSAFPFHELDNVIMTPHYSGWTRAALARRLEGIVRTIESFAASA